MDARFRLIINQSKAKSKMFRISTGKSASDLADTKMLKRLLLPSINCLHHPLLLWVSRNKLSIRAMSCLHIFNTRVSTNFKVNKINLFHSRTPGSYIKYCRTSKTPDSEPTFPFFKVWIGSSSTSSPICTSRDHSKPAQTSLSIRCLTMGSLKVILRHWQDFNNRNKQLRSNLTNLSVRVICSDPCNPHFLK